VAQQVMAQMRALDVKLENDVAPILSLLDALADSHSFRTLDARDQKQRLLAAQTHLLLAQSQSAPLVLVFENLQWIDDESRAFLDALIAMLPRSHLLLLMNYRPEFQHHWRGREGFTEIYLDPLAPSDARALLQALAGEDRWFVEIQDQLIARSNGNPFFLEEIVSTLAEASTRGKEPGGGRPGAKAAALQLPPTVQAVIPR